MKSMFVITLCCFVQVLQSSDIEKLEKKDRNGSTVEWAPVGDGETYYAWYTYFDTKLMSDARTGWKKLVDDGIVSSQNQFYYNGKFFWMYCPYANMRYRVSRRLPTIVVSKDGSGVEKSFEDKDLALFLKTRQVCYNAMPKTKNKL